MGPPRPLEEKCFLPHFTGQRLQAQAPNASEKSVRKSQWRVNRWEKMSINCETYRKIDSDVEEAKLSSPRPFSNLNVSTNFIYYFSFAWFPTRVNPDKPLNSNQKSHMLCRIWMSIPVELVLVNIDFHDGLSHTSREYYLMLTGVKLIIASGVCQRETP